MQFFRRATSRLVATGGSSFARRLAATSAASATAVPASAAATAAAASAAASAPVAPPLHDDKMCLLCDEDYDSLAVHNATASHVARFAVCQALVSPDKHAAMMAQMWDHIRLDFDAVDVINAEKLRRRRRRLGSTLKYLRESNVLVHSLLRRPADAAPGPSGFAVSHSFTKLAFIGENNARFVVADRVARLFPTASAGEVTAILDMVLRRHTLDVMYGLLEFDAHLPPGAVSDADAAAAPAAAGDAKEKPSTVAPARTSDEQRASMLLAVLGELHAHSSRDKPTAVAAKSAADALVLTVLSQHAVDNIYSELVHHVLQKMVEEGTPVWRDYKASLLQQSLRSSRPEPMPLAAASAAAAAAASETAAAAAADVCAADLMDLEAEAAHSGPAVAAAACNPRMVWTDTTRGGMSAVTVPHGKKNAFFAPMAPRLVGRARPAKQQPPPAGKAAKSA